jgi:two-component system cell cycle sensor histidine kinase/response regulator CckA
MYHRPTDPAFQDIMNIKQNANRAAGLVRQLLAFSRQQTLRLERLQLGDVLSELSILLGRLLGENIELKLESSGDLWPVRTDLNQFEQVIINLAVNARDAMPNGGRLVIRTANVGADAVRAFGQHRVEPGDYVMIEVVDTGEDLRALLLDEGGRARHRPWPLHGLRHHQADRRLHLRRERGGQRHDHARLPAARP